MTAKEIAKKNCLEYFRKKFPDVEFEDYYDTPEWMIEAMNEYTLHIAEQAVGEVRKKYNSFLKINDDFDEILSRIKNQKEE